MAFNLEVLRGTVSYNMYDGNPFSFEEADLGGASVRNIEERGPYQDGATHLDERLEPDVTTLRIYVKATSDALLDGYRDTLNKAFKPIKGVPITLKLTRDDGAVRQQDTRRTGKLSIPLVKELRPGHTHKAVVQLRAADPTWYDPTQQEEDFLVPTDWWLAYTTIGGANVLTHVENPSAGQLWANSGSVAAGSAWTIFIRSAYANGTANQFAFDTRNAASLVGVSFQAGTALFAGGFYANNSANEVTGAIMAAGTHNYFFVTNGANLEVYRDTTLVGAHVNGLSDPLPGSAAGTARWRRQHAALAADWPVSLPYAAVYNVALSSTQRQYLNDAVTVGSAYAANIVYTGDVDSYPVITITGPFSNPVLTNSTTGDVLDFTGGTVGSADVWTIDTRYGRKSALNAAGSSVANFLSDDSDLATFRLVSDPLAAGGNNTIVLSGSAGGSAAAVAVAYYNRYLSF